VPGRHGQDSGLVHEHINREFLGVADRQANKGNVKLSGPHPCGQQGRGARLGEHNDVGIIGPEFKDDCRYERMEVGAAGGADIDLSAFAAGTAAHAGLGLLHPFQNDAGFLEQQLAGIGQFDAARPAIE
jgi:hypothetical protein